MQNYNNYNIQPPNFQKTFLEEKFLEGGGN